ncbi:MAG: DUF952 domain-containing protein [Actinomycetota bacterium]|jgi:uncharacterized protein (DUF952 family)|nr:DUF952 domain-containing protein [Actinomycetota bacterium]
MTSIFHIADGQAWHQAVTAGRYIHESLDTEGFIHLSSRDQVVATTAKYYSEAVGLVLLEVDPATIDADLRWEQSTNGELFPHLYSDLPLSSVVTVHRWDKSAQRTFS